MKSEKAAAAPSGVNGQGMDESTISETSMDQAGLDGRAERDDGLEPPSKKVRRDPAEEGDDDGADDDVDGEDEIDEEVGDGEQIDEGEGEDEEDDDGEETEEVDEEAGDEEREVEDPDQIRLSGDVEDEALDDDGDSD